MFTLVCRKAYDDNIYTCITQWGTGLQTSALDEWFTG